MLSEGARVVVTGRDSIRGPTPRRRSVRRALFVAADAADAADVQTSRGRDPHAFGRLDVLVNNAGIALSERLVDTPVERSTGSWPRTSAARSYTREPASPRSWKAAAR